MVGTKLNRPNQRDSFENKGVHQTIFKNVLFLINGLIVETTKAKYQDQLLQLEKKLKIGLYSELVDKKIRITIDEVFKSLKLIQLDHKVIADVDKYNKWKNYILITISIKLPLIISLY